MEIHYKYICHTKLDVIETIVQIQYKSTNYESLHVILAMHLQNSYIKEERC
jgi:hypothetical protein